MKRHKALFLIIGGVAAVALIVLVSAPRVANSQGLQPVIVINPSTEPLYTQSVSQLPAQIVGLVCREDGETKTLNCEALPYAGDASFTPYSVSPTAFLMVTEVEIHDGNGVTASVTCSPNSSASYGMWEAASATTAQYVIPDGILLPPNCTPTVTLNKGLAGTQVFLRGYLTSGLPG